MKIIKGERGATREPLTVAGAPAVPPGPASCVVELLKQAPHIACGAVEVTQVRS
jgi:hypothetical protein